MTRSRHSRLGSYERRLVDRSAFPTGERRVDRDQRRRVLSQNFLRNAAAVDQFMNLVDIGPDDLVIEVGAGEGWLTVALARRSRAVIAYELDAALATRLTGRVGAFSNAEVVMGDFVASTPPVEPFRLVGNVPFSLTAPIVTWFLNAPAMRSATMITQLEYAKKRTGSYGRWSLLTIRTWPEYSWQLRGRIERTQFRPVPRVDAGVLHVDHRETPLLQSDRMASYRRMVDLGFGGRGGSLYASLSRQHPARRVAGAFDAIGLDRTTVVAYVSPANWLDLWRLLEPDRAPEPSASRSTILLAAVTQVTILPGRMVSTSQSTRSTRVGQGSMAATLDLPGSLITPPRILSDQSPGTLRRR
jgi:23S rRNA (adenine-N6)-dimethyltransferase